MNAYTPSALQSATARWALPGLSDEALDRAIDQAAHDESDDLGALLAERERRLDRRNPRIKLARLESQAEGHEAAEDRLRELADSHRERAQRRRFNFGSDDSAAAQFDLQAKVADARADAEAEARMSAVLKAAVLKSQIEQGEELMRIVR